MEGFANYFVEFCYLFPQPHSVLEQVFIPALSQMKIVNIHIQTIKTLELLCNSHISLQFSYQFAIFISVCNYHVLVYSSYMDICNFYMSLQFLYEFVIFRSVCNSHVMTPALTYVALHGFCHYDLELINSTSATVLREIKDKLELSKIDYYLLFKSSQVRS